MIGIADCNNFFASCERVFNPSLNGKPVVILSNNDGCIIARSNEAKALGIKMGDPLFKIQDQLEKSGVAIFSSNYSLYGDMSRRVMALLAQFTPKLSIYSIDEAFIDLSHIEDGNLWEYGQKIVRTINKGTGIPITIGIAPTKTLAKMASRFGKHYAGYKNVCIIDSEEKRIKALRQFPIGNVWGIGRKNRKELEYFGIRTAWDFTEKSESWIKRTFSISGLRTWLELKGTACISDDDFFHKHTICTSRSFADQGITDLSILEEAIAGFAASCTRKLQQQHCRCGSVAVFAQSSRFRTDIPPRQIYKITHFDVPTNSRQEIVSVVVNILRDEWRDNESAFFKRAGVMVFDIVPDHAFQTSIFDPIDRDKQQKLTKTIEEINRKNGHNTVRVAIEGFNKSLYIRSKHVSPCYTTNIHDIIKVSSK